MFFFNEIKVSKEATFLLSSQVLICMYAYKQKELGILYPSS